MLGVGHDFCDETALDFCPPLSTCPPAEEAAVCPDVWVMEVLVL
jgi:hypothetical protein